MVFIFFIQEYIRTFLWWICVYCVLRPFIEINNLNLLILNFVIIIFSTLKRLAYMKHVFLCQVNEKKYIWQQRKYKKYNIRIEKRKNIIPKPIHFYFKINWIFEHLLKKKYWQVPYKQYLTFNCYSILYYNNYNTYNTYNIIIFVLKIITIIVILNGMYLMLLQIH